MKRSDKLKQKRTAKITAKRALISSMAGLRTIAETRMLTDEEKAKLLDIKMQAEAIVAEVEEIDMEIVDAEEEERETEKTAEEEKRKKTPDGRMPVDFSTSEMSEADKRTINTFSMAKAMRNAANLSGLDGVEKEMHEEGVRELNMSGATRNGAGVMVPMVVLRNKRFAGTSRAMSVTGGSGGNKGGVLLRDEPIDYISLLKEKTPLISQYGVQMITGLQGDLPLVRQTAATTFGWKGEVADADLTDMTLSEYKMTPHRLTGQVLVSDRLLIQSSLDIEALLNEDIISSHAVILQKAVINGAGAASNQPLGLLNDADVISLALGVNGGSLDFAKVLALIQGVDDENSLLNDPKFLLGTKLRTPLKTGDIDAGSGLKIWDLITNTIDGYYADTSNIVPKNLTKGTGTALTAIIFGNWKDYVLGQWGGLEIIFDPYTKALSGQKVYTLNVFHDGVARRPKSFSNYKDVVTA